MFLKKKNIELKNAAEIEKMRVAGRVVGEILEKLTDIIKPGVTTKDIDEFSEKYIRSLKMVPAFLGVKGMSSPFPASACVSINDEVVHGIPNASRVLKSGDIVSVDMGVIYQGYYGDAAKTYAVGSISDTASKLLKITELSLQKGIEKALSGNRLGDVSHAVQKTVEAAGFSVVRDFVGHGIGRSLHEEPAIPNFGKPDTGVKLACGMVLAIEPMVNVGGYEVSMLEDDWTVVTRDGSLSAHFEHTVVITENGNEILTKV
ncbi:type I methionyl aminopeptidase [Endomicrobium proavitum]|uniref:Methionine aminopeptidase n=1 Tax=Endomicrobium proavitum TaxID=1408281 RepID=A0A0G3WLF0_9BACT|nr:type I methionyl aminopeptidase [Endomicrobium proavitum]AKL98692.1 Methionine aminopeptidase [Endomicrobium proavitum]